MAYARERQKRYVNTIKGKEASTRCKKKHQAKLRSTPEGRITLRYRRIKCEWGVTVADWWLKHSPTCFVCGPNILYNKAPSRKNKRSNQAELAIDHNHKYTRKDYKNNSNILPRGLLCQRHNLGAGMFKERKLELERMIEYLHTND